ncbi:hypothetical protein GCM10009092_06030 [Bowmanella denitrificans]|uniref:Solute-binding protein family 3/N-terminal domain-containing protein n=1 Tax=Bowmanella denitrificans TaxID=366582 RepID=A0ABN0WR40_9ALTE
MFLSGWLLCLVLFPAKAQPPQKIIWANFDFPPLYILKGELQGQGYTDKLIDYLESALPTYQHQRVVFPNYLRMEREAANGVPICDAAAFYQPPELREDTPWLLSAPHTVFFMHSLVVAKHSKYAFAEQESLAELLQQPQLKLGIQAGRPLGQKLDQLLQAHHKNSAFRGKNGQPVNLIERSAEDFIGLYSMLQRGNIDYLIDYFPQMAFATKTLGLAHDSFRMLSLSETAGQYGLAAIRCQQAMQKVIADINRLLIRDRPKPFFQTLTKRWGVRNPYPELADDIYQNKVLKIMD